MLDFWDGKGGDGGREIGLRLRLGGFALFGGAEAVVEAGAGWEICGEETGKGAWGVVILGATTLFVGRVFDERFGGGFNGRLG